MSSFEASWTIPKGLRNRTAEISWDGVPYAEAVYYGATARDGTQLPGRRFLDDPKNGALSQVDLEAIFAEVYIQAGSFDEAFTAASEALGDACQVAIRSDRWPWPNSTVREDGSTAGSRRDIVDSGRLANSQRGPFIS